MSVQYGLASSWKRMAEERDQSARTMTRIAIGLFIVCNVLAVTSFSAQSRYSSLCHFVGERAPDLAARASEEGVFARALLNDYCG